MDFIVIYYMTSKLASQINLSVVGSKLLVSIAAAILKINKK
jgi:hypothetical protein